LELCAVIGDISPMAVYRLVCALGQQCLVTVLTRCDLPLPAYVLADEKHYIPSDLVVDSWASSVESRSTLDSLYVPDA
jgi:hypothetical protein